MNKDTMNIFQLLAASAENGNGRTLQPTQVKEIVTVLQAMQYEIAEGMARTEVLTRLCVVLVDDTGGNLVMDSSDYIEAETRGLKADWSEEGDLIDLSTYEVDMPSVPVGDIPTSDEEGSDLASLPKVDGAEEEVEGTTIDPAEGS